MAFILHDIPDRLEWLLRTLCSEGFSSRISAQQQRKLGSFSNVCCGRDRGSGTQVPSACHPRLGMMGAGWISL